MKHQTVKPTITLEREVLISDEWQFHHIQYHALLVHP